MIIFGNNSTISGNVEYKKPEKSNPFKFLKWLVLFLSAILLTFLKVDSYNDYNIDKVEFKVTYSVTYNIDSIDSTDGKTY